MLIHLGRVITAILCAAFFFLWQLEAAEPSSQGFGPEGNTLIFWTDGEDLKSVTLMCVRGPRNPIGIVAIPVQVQIGPSNAGRTVAEAYRVLGRQKLSSSLEELFQIQIDHYLSIDQATLDKASQLIGPFLMNGKTTTLVDVFEGTYTSGHIDPQTEIRSLATSLVEPRVFIKMPQLVWILTSGVKTNLGCQNLIDIFRAIQTQGPGILNKKALPWHECVVNNRRVRDVPPDAWGQVLQSVLGCP